MSTCLVVIDLLDHFGVERIWLVIDPIDHTEIESTRLVNDMVGNAEMQYTYFVLDPAAVDAENIGLAAIVGIQFVEN